MPERNSVDTNKQSAVLRRSSRLSHHNGTPEQLDPTTPKRSQNPKPFDSVSRKTRVYPPDTSPSSARGTPVKQSVDFQGKSLQEKGESLNGSGNCSNGITGSRSVNGEDDGFCTPRRSLRLANLRLAFDEKKHCPDSFLNKRRESCNESSEAKLSSGSRSASLIECEGEVQGLRRSTRLRGLQGVDENSGNEKTRKFTSFGKGKFTEKLHSSFACKAKRSEKKSSETLGTTKKAGKRVCVLALKTAVEGNNERDNGVDRKVVGVKRKRKQRQSEDRSIEGWTKEQELALQRAYLVAKPTPQFWKKVAKLVPGKSAQECFDKIHSNFSTPPPTRPRSRAPKIKSLLPKDISLSASKLLNPTEKTRSFRRKSCLSYTSIRHLLQSSCEACQDNGADLFSILEPNVDLPVNAFQSSVVLSTPMQVKEKQGWLQKCSQKSYSSQKKPLSTFCGSFITDTFSPPVLKPVRNRVLHEKYIDRLHSREARRKAASTQAVSVTGKQGREGRSIPKGDVLQAAKLALVSKARNAISSFQHSQADFMNAEYSFDDDDGASIEEDDNEDESQ